jgi:hypothetical protein
VPGKKRFTAYQGSVAVAITFLLLLLLTPGTRELLLLIAGLLAAGSLLAGIDWLSRRFGAIKVILVLLTMGLTIAGAAWYAYWQDEPNRLLVAQIKQLGAYYVGSKGSFLTGEVDYVHFDSDANDDQVRQFTELQGLDSLERLFITNMRVSERTFKRFTRFTHLKCLYIEGSFINEDTLNELQSALPNCRIEVK